MTKKQETQQRGFLDFEPGDEVWVIPKDRKHIRPFRTILHNYEPLAHWIVFKDPKYGKLKAMPLSELQNIGEYSPRD